MLEVSWASHLCEFSSPETWFSHLLQLFLTSSCKYVLQTPTGSYMILQLCFVLTWVSYFPVLALTNYHKRDGFQQHGFCLTFLEVRSLRGVGRSVFLLEAGGENLKLPAFLGSWLPSSIFKPHQVFLTSLRWHQHFCLLPHFRILVVTLDSMGNPR